MIAKEKKTKIMEEYAITPGDTGSPEVQIAILTEMGLDSVQGFYFSKPRPNYEFRKFLKENPFDKEGYL